MLKNSELIAAFESNGIHTVTMVPALQENGELFRKYGASLDALVICAPNGDKLAIFDGSRCTAENITLYLKNLKKGS